jgi:DnaJ-class molecular chaperone
MNRIKTWKCPKCDELIHTDSIIRDCPNCGQATGGYTLIFDPTEPVIYDPKPELTRIMYHGTSEENSKAILETGFREGTYFTKDLASALIMGGMYLFEVWFSDEEHQMRDNCWEYISPTPVPKDKIIALRHFSQEKVYGGKEAEIACQKYTLSKMYPEKPFCTTCSGRGQLQDYDDYVGQWKNHLPVTACPACNGHGVLNRWD